MTQDVRQWLAEIKSLQQKLTEAQQERDEALKSAENWRNLYETEARQRRTEAKLTQQKIAAMQRELDVLKAPLPLEDPAAESAEPQAIDTQAIDTQTTDTQTIDTQTIDTQTVSPQVSQLDVEALQIRLIEVSRAHDRLQQALRSEQTAHQQTRIELTAALGDAIERLTQERARSQSNQPSKPEESAPAEPPAVLLPSKSPSLELPQFD